MFVTSNRVHGARSRVRIRSGANFLSFLFELCDVVEGKRSVQECCRAAPVSHGGHGYRFESRREPFFADFYLKLQSRQGQTERSR